MRDGQGAGPDAIAAETALRLYANDLAVGLSLSEVELRFGQHFGGDEAPLVLSWIVTSPVHLAVFGRIIEAAVARYEAQFGPIPDAGAPAGRTGG